MENKPEISPCPLWSLVGEFSANISLEQFRWVMNEFTIRGQSLHFRSLWKTEVLFPEVLREIITECSPDGGMNVTHAPLLPGTVSHVLRRVFRKDISKAPHLDEWVTQCHPVDTGLAVVVFTPIVPAADEIPYPQMSYLPYNYPKSRQFAFSFHAPSEHPGKTCLFPSSATSLNGTTNVECSCHSTPHSATATVRMHVVPFVPESLPFLEVTARKMLKQVSKWAASYDVASQQSQYQKRVVFDRFVSEDEFRKKYTTLKGEHKGWVASWPESTDAVKFVYEETAIAAYLLCLWERDSLERGASKVQTFVDMGCGNGFLTYLLIKAGHSGIGIDLQSRKIWKVYEPAVSERLREEEIVGRTAVFPGVDWIVGNHSDELTPWIPQIARRSGPHTNFFVIPCCFYDFHEKFQGNDKRIGQYQTYLNYICLQGRRANFDVEIENLRIPSTKYVSLIGRPSEVPLSDFSDNDDNEDDDACPTDTTSATVEHTAFTAAASEEMAAFFSGCDLADGDDGANASAGDPDGHNNSDNSGGGGGGGGKGSTAVAEGRNTIRDWRKNVPRRP